jgi:hypothetical protein
MEPVAHLRFALDKEKPMPREQKQSGNPDLIKQHKEKQRLGERELARKPGKEPAHANDETAASGGDTSGGTEP